MTADSPGFTRRTFIRSSAATVGGTAALCVAGAADAQDAPARPADPRALHEVSFVLNGETLRASVDARTTLADFLREERGLTGTKIGCNHGQCGACTIHLDGRRILSCLTLAVQADGAQVTTIEGLTAEARTAGIEVEGLHPVQAAFVEHDALQCGYCTPGQVMSAVACIREGHAGSPEQVREYMSGNLCRCAAYPNITAAVLAARGSMTADAGAPAAGERQGG